MPDEGWYATVSADACDVNPNPMAIAVTPMTAPKVRNEYINSPSCFAFHGAASPQNGASTWIRGSGPFPTAQTTHTFVQITPNAQVDASNQRPRVASTCANGKKSELPEDSGG